MRGMWVWKGRPHPKASPLNSPDLREKNLKSNDNSWLRNTKNNISPSAALLLRDLPKRKRGLCPGRPLNLREQTPIKKNDVGLHLAPQASFFSPHSAAPVYPLVIISNHMIPPMVSYDRTLSPPSGGHQVILKFYWYHLMVNFIGYHPWYRMIPWAGSQVYMYVNPHGITCYHPWY